MGRAFVSGVKKTKMVPISDALRPDGSETNLCSEMSLRREIFVGDMKMKFNRLAFVIAFVLTAVLFAEVAVHAQESTPSTKITGSQSTDTLR
jgi:hypothetical protein